MNLITTKPTQEGLTAEDELVLCRVLGAAPPSLPPTPDYHSPAPSLPSPGLPSPGCRGQYSTPPPNMLPGGFPRPPRAPREMGVGGVGGLVEDLRYTRLAAPQMPPREAPRPGTGWAPMPPMPAPLSGGLPPHIPTAIVPPGVPPHTRPPQWSQGAQGRPGGSGRIRPSSPPPGEQWGVGDDQEHERSDQALYEPT